MKKLLSILLVLVMLMGIMPAQAEPTQIPAWETLMDTLAESYVDSTDAWTVMDMAIYSALPGKDVEISASARQATLNALIAKAVDESAYVSDLAKGEIVLRAMGIDSAELYLADGEAVSNTEALASLDYSLGGYYSAPWVLIAGMQGNLTLSETQVNDLISLMDASSGTGLFESEWDGVVYTDIDTAMIAVAALAPIYETNQSAQALVDKIMTAVAGVQDENGSFGSANTDAMVIIGLLALGEDPTTWNGKSVLDGMLSYVNPETGKFQFWGEDNEMSTEQAFRALVAYAMFDGENAVNFYDFSAKEVVAGREALATEEPATEEPTEEPLTETPTEAASEVPTEEVTEVPSLEPTEQPTQEPTAEPTEEATEEPTEEPIVEPTQEPTAVPTEQPDMGGGIIPTDITVKVSIKTDRSTWMDHVRVTVPKNSSVKEALEKALEKDETIEAFGIREGYITAFKKDGEKLSQFDKGAGSGWKYKVNGTAPSKPFSSCKLQNGDDILWYYTVDYTEEEHKGDWVVTPPKKPTAEPTVAPTEAPTETPSFPFKDTENHWATEGIRWAYDMGIMQGMSEEEFSPEFPLSRGMIVTILYRLEGTPEHKGITSFEDVGKDAWYYDAVLWANEVGIVKGVSDAFFFPDSSITRQDLAVILYRYAQYKEMDVSVGEDTNILSYEDVFSVSEYAIPALQWTAGAGVMSGRTPSTLNPKETASRAEAATILMRFLSE